MPELTLTAYRTGDGFLTVDTDAWLDSISETDEELTEAFRAYADEHGDDLRSQTERLLLAWITDRFGPESAEPQFDTYMPGVTSYWTGNGGDNFLSDDYGATLVNPVDPAESSLLVITADAMGTMEYPSSVTVRRITAYDHTAVYYDSHAIGECGQGHQWSSDDGYRMTTDRSDHMSNTVKITDRIYVPMDAEGFDETDKAYVRCPFDGTAIAFMTTY